MTGLLTGLKHGLNRFPYCSLPHVIAIEPINYPGGSLRHRLGECYPVGAAAGERIRKQRNSLE